ncbi:unnamed protein product [Acanthosepion pharaonis]|uniref:Reverse transcriptase domain-containing protein n=1 Tax=Acanthosepion pharaonis TaxID=158019 RepID=A0A812D111_ACAPH|nr:unnamed protein product [Sepia pharaonis]
MQCYYWHGQGDRRSVFGSQLMQSAFFLCSSRNYRILRRQLREAIRTDSNARWSRVAEEAERASTCGDTRKLYQLLKQAGRGAIGHGDTLLCRRWIDPLTEVAEKVSRWREHFDVLLNHQPPAVQLDLQPADGTYNCSVDPPTIQEILSVLRQLRNNKAPGEDGIPAEVYKALPDIFAPWLHRVFNAVWTTETVPDDWGHAVLLPFFKKGDKKVCSNYRGISLLDVAAKTFAVLLLKRFQTARDARTRPTQCGFRPGKGCVDQIFNLRRTLEQRWAYQQPTVLCFIDFAAAFDSVDRDALGTIELRGCGCGSTVRNRSPSTSGPESDRDVPSHPPSSTLPSASSSTLPSAATQVCRSVEM